MGFSYLASTLNHSKDMTSRERVLAALNHMEPDRIPLDRGGHRSSGIAAIAYHCLRKHLGLTEKPVRVYDMVQQLAIIDEDLLDMFGVDTIEMGRGFLLDDAEWKPWVLPDGTPCEIPCYTNLERKGEDWFVGTLTANRPRNIEIPLTFLDRKENYEVVIFFQNADDLKNNQVRMEKILVDQKTVLSRELLKNSGMALIFKKI